MKIVTLFGSFNPLTNAHVQLLKEAVKQLGADKSKFAPFYKEFGNYID